MAVSAGAEPSTGSDPTGAGPQAESPGEPRPPRTRQRGVSVASRLAATMLGVGLAALLAATLVGIDAGQRLGRGIVDGVLSSSQAAGAREVASQLTHYERLAQQMATSPEAAVAIERFADAFEPLDGLAADALIDRRQRLLESYETRYFGPLRALGQDVQIRDVLATDPASIYLQGSYSLPEPPVTDPATVDDAGDGSVWSTIHVQYHPAYRTAAREADLRDVYLVDADSERVVYSVAKGPDLGTSLAVGPYSGTVVSRAADAAIDGGTAVVTDLDLYRAAPDGPVGAAAAPVRARGEVVGAIVLTYDADIYTERLSALMPPESAGGGDARGQMYLVGPDGTTRSDPQAFVADPDAYLEAAGATGSVTVDEQAAIERAGTTVLIQSAADSTVNAARSGDTSAAAGTGIEGGSALVGVEPVQNDDVGWSVAREIDAEGAEATVAVFRRILLVGSAVFVVALAFVAVAWATWFLRPVRLISERLGTAALANLGTSPPDPITIPDRSAVELHRLAQTFTDMGTALVDQRQAVATARAGRLDVMKRLLPPAVAQRIARGDVEVVEQVPSVTVGVVVVLGLGRLLADDPVGSRRTLDELHHEIDGIAEAHGVDRIKVVGDSYFAACGHDQPYIDHAPRMVRFAAEVADAVSDVSQRAGVTLSAAIGVASGPAYVGMAGRDHLIYDVWGPTVSSAHTLARSAGPGDVVMTEAARERLPADIGTVAWGEPAAASAREESSTRSLWSLSPDALADVGDPEVVS